MKMVLWILRVSELVHINCWKLYLAIPKSQCRLNYVYVEYMPSGYLLQFLLTRS